MFEHINEGLIRKRHRSLGAGRGGKNRIDLTGKRFGNLLVVGRASEPGRRQEAYWDCICECGGRSVTSSSHLRSGHSRSCGCLRHGNPRDDATRTKDIPEYGCWRHMLSRCTNPRVPAFPDYGGRGVTVCDRWQSFKNFLADMGPRPSPEHSIDRYPDNAGNYEPGNCRWATMKQQSNNRRDNVLLSFDGREQTLSEWADEIGIKYQTLRRRIRVGWTPERALTVPLLRQGKAGNRGV